MKQDRQFKYNVLVPRYKDSGQTDFKGNKLWYVSWKKVGEANSLQEAKGITKLPVLEPKPWFKPIIKDLTDLV